MLKLTGSEKLMYDVIAALENGGVPVVYKGAMITKLILNENHFDDFARETQDIDASWAGASNPPMEQLADMLNRAVAKLELAAIVKRAYGGQKSAGFIIVDAGGNEKLSIDIDMRRAIDSCTYQYGNVTFMGATPGNVIADKISAISTDKVFRRAKDLIDLYALAHCVTIKTADIRAIWERESRAIESFDAFRNRLDDLKHAYKMLRRLTAKPDFDKLYGYLTHFLAPFIEAREADLVWSSGLGDWADDKARNNPTAKNARQPDFIGHLHGLKAKADKENTNNHQPPKQHDKSDTEH
jgi:hypothetical protein